MEAQELREKISSFNEQAILWDDLDHCIVGVSIDGRVVYDVRKLINHFVQEGMQEIDAIEHIDYNIIGSHVGEFTPIHIHTITF